VREELLNRLHTAINSRDSQRMLAEAKELYASAEARANNTIKQAEELSVRVRAVEEREQAVDELEQKLQEREALDDLRIERELACLATRESSLEIADTRECALDTRTAEVADRERLLAKQQM
jgi:hypothetical protein